MLNEMVPARYKVSNTPNLTGWNLSMSVRAILDQLMANYGMPDAMILFNNDTLLLHRAMPRDPNHWTGPVFPDAHHQCRRASPDAIGHFPHQRIRDMGRHAKQDVSRPKDIHS